MIPNLLFVDISGSVGATGTDHVLEFCESLTDDAYVYLLRPSGRPMEDSPGGVRILSHDLNHLPRFGSLAGVVAVGDPRLLAILKEGYPDVPLHMLVEQADQNTLVLCAKYSANQLLGGLADKTAQLLGYPQEYERLLVAPV